MCVHITLERSLKQSRNLSQVQIGIVTKSRNRLYYVDIDERKLNINAPFIKDKKIKVEVAHEYKIENICSISKKFLGYTILDYRPKIYLSQMSINNTNKHVNIRKFGRIKYEK